MLTWPSPALPPLPSFRPHKIVELLTMGPFLAVAPWMRLVVDFQHVIRTDMGIFLRCRKLLMAEQFLNGPQVGAVIQQVRGKGMSQRVRTGTGRESSPLAMFFDQQLHATRAETTTTMIHKERRRFLPG